MVVSLFLSKPFKVTDPNHPHFKITRFNIGDYDTVSDLSAVLDVILSEGMKRCEVEKLLMIYGGAVSGVSPEVYSAGVRYWYEHNYRKAPFLFIKCPYSISIEYQKNNSLKSVSITEVCGFEHNIELQELPKLFKNSEQPQNCD